MADINEDDFAKKWGFAPSTSASAPAINEDDFAKKWGYASAAEPVAPPTTVATSASVPASAPEQPIPSNAVTNSPGFKVYKDLSDKLAPDPNMEYVSFAPLARNKTTGELHYPVLPSFFRDIAQGALDATMAPKIGTVTPLTTNALSMAVPSLNPSVAAGTYGLVNGSATKLVPGPNGKNILAAPNESGNPLSAPTPQVTIPSTSAEAKQVASAFYDQAAQSGGVLTPKFTNNFIDSVTKQLPQTEAGKVVAGESPVSALVDRLGQLRDKPLSLPEAQEIDEALGNLVTKEYSVKGLTADGKKIQDIQSALRDQIANAGEGDVEGGSTGFGDLSNARKAWSQAMKMRDLERVQERANMTDNPQTSVKTQLRMILTNPAKIRGYSPEEVDALRAATDRGAMGNLLHVFGSRLIPIAAGAAEAGTGGLTSGLAAAGAAHVATSLMRNAASKMAANRLATAMQILGRNVPQNPLSAP